MYNILGRMHQSTYYNNLSKDNASDKFFLKFMIRLQQQAQQVFTMLPSVMLN